MPTPSTSSDSAESSIVSIKNASEHNLKNVSLDIPRNVFGVITGVSGSGKSSLAFDTLFKEGQRRYLASLSAYARQFVGSMERPAVDLIEGLSPTISIDQKTSGRNPRSTVGTITEIYDFIRLLYSRLGVPHCPEGHGQIQGQTAERIVDHLMKNFAGEQVLIMAPVVRERKGEYRKELESAKSQGFLRVRIDSKVYRLDDLANPPELGRYEKHTLEIVVDRLRLVPEARGRVDEAVGKCLSLADGILSVALHENEMEEADTSTNKKKVKSREQEIAITDKRVRYQRLGTARSCSHCGFSIPELEPRLFSFNVPQGACPDCAGLGYKQSYDPERFIKNELAPLLDGALMVLNPEGNILYMGVGRSELTQIARYYKIDLKQPYAELPDKFKQRILHGTGKEKDGIDFDIISSLDWLYQKYSIPFLERYMRTDVCESCEGKRLNPVSLHVLFHKEDISEFTSRTVGKLVAFLTAIRWTEQEKPVAEPILREILERLRFLEGVGLEYLTLNRRANTLSGGESQRIRLASQVGSGLEGCLYILDEPSIGLHQSDNKRLIETLRKLRDKSNTVYVIEHDEETMLSADHLVDIGPGAGIHGGEVIYNGTPAGLLATKDPTDGISSTRAYLIGDKKIPIPKVRRPLGKSFLKLSGLTQNNLKNLSAEFPLGVLTVLTGVSGSGKSTLALDLLRSGVEENLRLNWHQRQALLALEGADTEAPKSKNKKPITVKKPEIPIKGIELIDKLIEIDQRPIGRTPRSNPATYTAAMNYVRDLFAIIPESKVRGYDKGRFSFNVKGGRCEECGGAGVVEIDMQLFSQAEVVCETCNGKRFNTATLEIHYNGKNIYQVLEMTIEEAADFFQGIPKLNHILNIMVRLGLGYVKLGQSSNTLSGGEAQRIKLATELAKRPTGKTLYLLDEPTTGLHFEDIRKLLEAIHSLVDSGNTVIVIEHNLDVICSADHLIEMGPGGGEAGGKIIAVGTPEELAKTDTPTGLEIKKHLARKQKNGVVKSVSEKKVSSVSKKKEVPALFKHGKILLRGVHKHNLKNVDLDLPKGKMITFTGRSGSGKTSLAFDTIFQEGQRKYIESLSTYARRFLGRIPRAEADRIEGISPTIAVDQKTGGRNPRSTLATQTEIYDSLRVLWANIGILYDPKSGKKLIRYRPSELAGEILKTHASKTILILAPLYESESRRKQLLDEPVKLLTYLPMLKEKGHLRIDLDGEMFKIDDEEQLSKISKDLSKRERLCVVLDRMNLGEFDEASKKLTTTQSDQRSRLVESIEKAYELGEGVLFVRDDNGKNFGYASYYASFESKFYFDDDLTPRHFSFNHHLGACPRCQGIGLARAFSENRFIADPTMPLFKGAIIDDVSPFFTRRGRFYGALLRRAANRMNIDIWETPWTDLTRDEKTFLLYGSEALRTSDATYADIDVKWKGIAAIIEDLSMRSESEKFAAALSQLIDFTTCPECHGGRLSPALMSVRVGGKAIHEVTRMTVKNAKSFFDQLLSQLTVRDQQMVGELVDEIHFRLTHLLHLGLHYLNLDRGMATLSGGEMQRVRLSTQIGNKLKDVIYVLDEPTVGLHERETEQLLTAIEALRDRGNTVIMVEHDGRVIRASDFVVDIGPGAGREGGNVSYAGRYAPAQMSKASFYPYLEGEAPKTIFREIKKMSDASASSHLLLSDITENNISHLDLKIPLGILVGICGVSGSGKSSLLDWFVPRIKEAVTMRKIANGSPVVHVEGGKVKSNMPFTRVEYVDQSPLQVNSRSVTAGVMDIYDPIRDIFALTKEAKARGFEKGHFSFNSQKGRCATCEGRGVQEVEMHFLSDVAMPCESCGGKRFRREVLEILYKGKSISEVLELTFKEAYAFFDSFEKIKKRIQLLLDAGLGYLQLGLSTHYLSGGELQRLKIATEIANANHEGKTLYLLDEPTTGLHFADTELLIRILDKLVKAGHSVVVIEHNREFLGNCDYLIDLGPEGGDGGGQLVAAGTPEELKKIKAGHTYRYL